MKNKCFWVICGVIMFLFVTGANAEIKTQNQAVFFKTSYKTRQCRFPAALMQRAKTFKQDRSKTPLLLCKNYHIRLRYPY